MVNRTSFILSEMNTNLEGNVGVSLKINEQEEADIHGEVCFSLTIEEQESFVQGANDIKPVVFAAAEEETISINIIVSGSGGIKKLG